jgi:hypothetical protein
MQRESPTTSWKSILEDIGKKPSPKAWEKYDIPEGTPWKTAVGIRLYKAIIEEGAYQLIPKLWEYEEPRAKEIPADFISWKVQFDSLGVPTELVQAQLRVMLTQMVEKRLEVEEGGTRVLGLGRGRRAYPERAERSEGVGGDTPRGPDLQAPVSESETGQATGQDDVGPDAETETIEGNSGV